MKAGLDHGHLAVQNCCVTWLGSGLLAMTLGGFGFSERWIPASAGMTDGYCKDL